MGGAVISGLDQQQEGAPEPAEPTPTSEHRPIPEPPASGVRLGSLRPPAPAPYIVLVGLDLSEPGGRAWRFAFDLAALRGEAEIHAVVVGNRRFATSEGGQPLPSRVMARPNDALRAPPLKVLQHRSLDGQPRLMAMHFRYGRTDRAIVQLACELGANLIVIASHPTNPLQRLFGGSVADRISRQAPCPVVVVKPKKNDDDPGIEMTEP